MKPSHLPPFLSFQAVFASQRQTEASRRREQNEEDSALMTHISALWERKSVPRFGIGNHGKQLTNIGLEGKRCEGSVDL